MALSNKSEDLEKKTLNLALIDITIKEQREKIKRREDKYKRLVYEKELLTEELKSYEKKLHDARRLTSKEKDRLRKLKDDRLSIMALNDKCLRLKRQPTRDIWEGRRKPTGF